MVARPRAEAEAGEGTAALPIKDSVRRIQCVFSRLAITSKVTAISMVSQVRSRRRRLVPTALAGGADANFVRLGV